MNWHHARPRLAAALVTVALPLSACAAGNAAARRLPAPPTTGPAVHLSEAVPLDKLENDQWQANLTDKLDTPQVDRTTYFGEMDVYDDPDADPSTDAPDDAFPIIATKTGDQWRAIPLVTNALRRAGWKYVGAGPSLREIWGAMDTVAGDSRSRFVLAHSTDGGATFSLTTFAKPCKLAQFFDFAMSRDGHGRATLSLDTDCGPHKAGLYHYETIDDGKTWSLPRFEPDVMIRSDPVPDEEQPDAPTTASKTSLEQRSAMAAPQWRAHLR